MIVTTKSALDTILSQFQTPPVRSSRKTFSKIFPHQNYVYMPFLPILATRLAHRSFLNLSILTTVDDLHKPRSSRSHYNIPNCLLI